jgi:class 3 adenylate cyclase
MAIDCAAASVAAMRPLGIEVRTGIHIGEVEVRGGDVAGMAVHIGSRIAALAAPSEVLVSSTVREIVTGSRRCSKHAANTNSKVCLVGSDCIGVAASKNAN